MKGRLYSEVAIVGGKGEMLPSNFQQIFHESKYKVLKQVPDITMSNTIEHIAFS